MYDKNHTVTYKVTLYSIKPQLNHDKVATGRYIVTIMENKDVDMTKKKKKQFWDIKSRLREIKLKLWKGHNYKK